MEFPNKSPAFQFNPKAGHVTLGYHGYFCRRSKSMSDVSAEDVQNLRQLRYEEMQKIKSQLKEQDQKWQDVSTLLGEGKAGGKSSCWIPSCFFYKKISILEMIFLPTEWSSTENMISFLWKGLYPFLAYHCCLFLKATVKNIVGYLFSHIFWVLKNANLLPYSAVNLFLCCGQLNLGVWLLLKLMKGKDLMQSLEGQGFQNSLGICRERWRGFLELIQIWGEINITRRNILAGKVIVWCKSKWDVFTELIYIQMFIWTQT